MAVLLTWVLFLLWAAIGLAVLQLGRYRWTLTTVLLAPAVGFAAVLVPTYILIRFGVPVRLSGVPVLAVLLALSGVVLWRARPTRARAAALWRQGRVFALILVGAFGLTAWPMIGYGFDWVANGNDDMACYCLSATGYRDHAFATVPTFEDLHEGRDGTQSYWFFTVLFQVRPSELPLALASVWTGLTALQVFMPVIVALNLALVAAASGMACAGAGRRTAVWTGALLAVSAVTVFGVVHQLLGQVGGLALLCAALVLVWGRFRLLPAALILRRAGACGLVFAGLLVFYPEIVPVLVGACVVRGVRDLLRGRLDRRHLVHAAAAILVMTALVPVYTFGAATFILRQAGATGVTDAIREIFPYYLTPRGPALLCGLLPLAGEESEAFQNVCMVAGFLLAILILLLARANSLRGRAFAAALVAIILMVGVLYAQGAAFGLFKIAMFVQPFLWAAVAAWAASRRNRWAAVAAAALLLAVAGLNVRAQFWYVSQSRGKDCRVLLPVRRGTMDQFRAEFARRTVTGDVDRVFLVTENNILIKLLAAEIRTVPIAQIGYAPFDWIARGSLSNLDEAPWVRTHREWEAPLRSLRTELVAAAERGRLTVVDPQTHRPLHQLMEPSADRTVGRPERSLVVAGTGRLSVFNRYRYPETGPEIICTPLSELQNFAAFCDATGARQYYVAGMQDPGGVALYMMEQDPIFPKRTLAAAGRSIVLDVLNPSPRVRALVNYTSSLKADPRAREVSPAEVVGDRRVALGAVGIGSARLVSPPLATQPVGPARFLVVNFGTDPTMNPNRLASAESLWGADIRRDRRRLIGHLRDLSVLSEEEYAAFRPPQAVAKFPADLVHPHLEYSGFGEEGWIGPEAKMRLTQSETNQECVIRGQVPGLPGAAGFGTELTVLVDGVRVEGRALVPGEFEVRVPGGAAPGPRWVELRFSHTQVLPAPDGRCVSALIRSIGFEPRNEALAHPPQKLSAFPGDLEHPKLEPSGIHTDGWGDKTFSARLWQAAPGGAVVVRGQIPEIGGNGAFRTELTVLVDGVAVTRRTLGPGDFEVRAPAAKTAQAHRIECRFTDTQALPPPDTRRVGAHLRYLGFESESAP